jgi:hypothetical protein
MFHAVAGWFRRFRRRGPRKTDPPLTRRGFSAYGRLRKSLSGLVELTGIEPVTS